MRRRKNQDRGDLHSKRKKYYHTMKSKRASTFSCFSLSSAEALTIHKNICIKVGVLCKKRLYQKGRRSDYFDSITLRVLKSKASNKHASLGND